MKGKTILFKEIIGSILFIMPVLIGFFFSFVKCVFADSSIIISRHDTIKQFENSYNDLFTSSKTALNLFSLTQRALFKHETRNFEVLRDSTNQLYLGKNGWPSDEKTIEKIAEQVLELRNVTESYGGYFIFYQTPYKNAGMAKDLEYYSNDSTELSEDYICELLEEQGISVCN